MRVPFSPRDLETIVSTVSKTIRCLAFKKCDMTSDHINVLATLPSLHLHQFVVLDFSRQRWNSITRMSSSTSTTPMAVDLAAVGGSLLDWLPPGKLIRIEDLTYERDVVFIHDNTSGAAIESLPWCTWSSGRLKPYDSSESEHE